MKVSLLWLNEFVKIEQYLSKKLGTTDKLKIATDIADTLSRTGNEVEQIIDNSVVQKVVSAKVLSKTKHPDSDKLSVCVVDDGVNHNVQVVCGAKNVEAGQIIPFAQVGAVLPNDINIKQTKIRGVESNGMICSESELGLADTSDGILVLPSDTKLGLDLVSEFALNDIVLDIGVTSNRGDCLSILGIAREISALYGIEIDEPSIIKNAKKLTLPTTSSSNRKISIEIESEKLVPIFSTKIIQNVTVEDSPFWLKSRLHSVGVKPINNIVDITNYFCIGYGHPMHAFDLDKIHGDKISIKTIKETPKNSVTLLNKKPLEIEKWNTTPLLTVNDESGVLTIAGVIGGIESSVTSSTKNILLECATFDSATVRRGAKLIGVSTDSSYRFERNVDKASVNKYLTLATKLFISMHGGMSSEEIYSSKKGEFEQLPKIECSITKINSLLGTDEKQINKDNVTKILTNLGLPPTFEGNDKFHIDTPTFRSDITRTADVIEEVARIYGLDNIPVAPIKVETQQHRVSEVALKTRKLYERLATLGFYNAVNFAFTSSENVERFDTDTKNFIKLANPLSNDLSTMRTTVISTLLQTLAYNFKNGHKQAKLFEIANTHRYKNGTKELDEQLHLSFVFNKSIISENWLHSASLHNEHNNSDAFFYAKYVVENILELFNITHNRVEVSAQNLPLFLHPGKSAKIMVKDSNNNKIEVGYVGHIHPNIIEAYELPDDVVGCELNVSLLFELDASVVRKFKEFSRYQSVRRDISIVVPYELNYSEIEGIIYAQSKEHITDVSLIDEYITKDEAAKHTRSLTIRLTLEDNNKTMIDSEIQEIVDKCVSTLNSKHNITLRS